MRLDQALNKIKIEVVSSKTDGRKATMLFRVPKDSNNPWGAAIQEFLLAATKLKEGWETDVSQVYFVDEGSETVRRLWRVVLEGNLKDGAAAFSQAIIRTLATSVEVTSMPLTGRVEYGGGYKGAHNASSNMAAAVIAKEFTR